MEMEEDQREDKENNGNRIRIRGIQEEKRKCKENKGSTMRIWGIELEYGECKRDNGNTVRTRENMENKVKTRRAKDIQREQGKKK